MTTSRWYRASVVAALAVAVVAVLGARRSPGTAPDVAPAGRPRLLELGSTTCIPCKQMEPILAELRRDYAGRLDVDFVDVYKEEATARKHQVEIIPTQVLFDAQGQEVFRHEGFFPREEILAAFGKHGIDLAAAPAGPASPVSGRPTSDG